MYRYFTDLDLRWAMQGGLKMLSIRVNSIEATRIVSPVVDSVWVYWTWMQVKCHHQLHFTSTLKCFI